MFILFLHYYFRKKARLPFFNLIFLRQHRAAGQGPKIIFKYLPIHILYQIQM